MDESLDDRSVADESAQRSESRLLRDVLVGGGKGIALAGLWILLAIVGARPESLKGCLLLFALFVVLVVVVPSGIVAGYSMGGTAGAIGGGVIGYLAPFIAYGVWVQRTVGWAAWFRPNSPDKYANGEPGSKA